MKVLRLIIIATAITGLASCSSADSATPATTVAATTTTTVVAPDCSQSALDAAGGEKVYPLGCSSNWAALQLSSQECGEHCYAFIYKWDQAKWNLAMKCSQYSPLSAAGSCEGMTGKTSDANYSGMATEFPSEDAVCDIWAKSLYGSEPDFKKACA